MTAAIVLISYFSGIEIPVDLAAILELAGNALASALTVLVVLV